MMASNAIIKCSELNDEGEVCGAELAPNVKYCSQCGNKVAKVIPKATVVPPQAAATESIDELQTTADYVSTASVQLTAVSKSVTISQSECSDNNPVTTAGDDNVIDNTWDVVNVVTDMMESLTTHIESDISELPNSGQPIVEHGSPVDAQQNPCTTTQDESSCVVPCFSHEKDTQSTVAVDVVHGNTERPYAGCSLPESTRSKNAAENEESSVELPALTSTDEKSDSLRAKCESKHGDVTNQSTDDNPTDNIADNANQAQKEMLTKPNQCGSGTDMTSSVSDSDTNKPHSGARNSVSEPAACKPRTRSTTLSVNEPAINKLPGCARSSSSAPAASKPHTRSSTSGSMVESTTKEPHTSTISSASDSKVNNLSTSTTHSVPLTASSTLGAGEMQKGRKKDKNVKSVTFVEYHKGSVKTSTATVAVSLSKHQIKKQMAKSRRFSKCKKAISKFFHTQNPEELSEDELEDNAEYEDVTEDSKAPENSEKKVDDTCQRSEQKTKNPRGDENPECRTERDHDKKEKQQKKKSGSPHRSVRNVTANPTAKQNKGASHREQNQGKPGRSDADTPASSTNKGKDGGSNDHGQKDEVKPINKGMEEKSDNSSKPGFEQKMEHCHSGDAQSTNDSQKATDSTKPPTYASVTAAGSSAQHQSEGVLPMSSSADHSPTPNGYVEVHFHVALSHLFEFSKDFDLLCIALSSYSQWRFLPLCFDRFLPGLKQDQPMVLMNGVQWFPADQQFVDYKYVVVRRDGVSKDLYLFEYIDEHMNRTRRLAVPKKCTSWHQFDGVARPERGWWQKAAEYISSFKSDFESDSYLAGLAALPLWEGLCYEGHRAVKGHAGQAVGELINVARCIEHSFLDSSGKPAGKALLHKVITEFVKKNVEKLQLVVCNKLTEEHKVLKLATSMALVAICNKYQVYSKEVMPVLCHGLLLQPDEQQQKCTDYAELVSFHFPASIGSILTDLTSFFQVATSGEYFEPLAMFAVPLLHFLARESEPYKPVPLSDVRHNTDGAMWWTSQRLRGFIASVKSHRDQLPLTEYLDKLVPLFIVDRLLPRTLMACLTFEHISAPVYGCFPPDVCLANLYYFVHSRQTSDDAKLVTCLEIIRTYLVPICERTVEKCKSDSSLSDQVYYMGSTNELCEISIDLLDAICSRLVFQKYMYKNLILEALKISLATIGFLSEMISSENECQAALNDHFRHISSNIDKWFGSVLALRIDDSVSQFRNISRPNIDEELLLFKTLLEIDVPNTAFHAAWTEKIQSFVISRLDKVTKPEYAMELFSCCNWAQYNCHFLEDSFCDMAFRAVTSAKVEDIDNLWTRTQRGDVIWNDKSRKLLSQIFLKAWPCTSAGNQDILPISVLKHVLNWRPFVHYIHVGGEHFELIGSSAVLFNSALHLLNNVVKGITTGNIEFSHLDILLANQEQLLKLAPHIDLSCVPESGVDGINKVQVLQKLLTWREREKQQYENVKRRIRCLVDFCSQIKDAALDVNTIKKQLAKDSSELTISLVCEPLEYSADNADNASYDPNITCFKIDSDILDAADKLYTLQGSCTFQRLWQRYCQTVRQKLEPEASEEESDQEEVETVLAASRTMTSLAASRSMTSLAESCVTVGKIVEEVCCPCLEEWNKLCSELVEGSISVGKLEEIFSDLMHNREQIEKEVLLMVHDAENGEGHVIAEERRKQIHIYNTLSEYRECARVILDARDKLKLTGDFTDLEVLLDMGENKARPLNSITSSLLQSAGLLKEFDKGKAHCIDVYLQNLTLVDWLRESVKAPNELLTLVDLAMIMAQGQGDYAVGQVTQLQSSVMGYTPFIYELPDDCSFDQFIKLCQDVWQNLAADPDLPLKFSETAQRMEWLNQIKMSNGSLEENALMVAQSINKNAKFCVGCITQHETDGEALTLDEVICVEYTLIQTQTNLGTNIEVTGSANKTIDLQGLMDLQSRLMLIVGKESNIKTEVDRFVETMNAVLRLAKTYNKLCGAGCLLFREWKAVFLRESIGKNVYFQFGENTAHTLTSHTIDIVSEIHNSAVFLEQCLERWLEHMQQQRSSHYYLNFFTTEQLIILQRELAKLTMGKVPDKHLFQLLASIGGHCGRDKLLEVLMNAASKLEAAENKETSDVNVETTDERGTFIAKMIESGFTHSLAVRALESGIEAAEVDKGILWCMDNETVDISENESDEADEFNFSRLPGFELTTSLASMTSNLVGSVLEKPTEKVSDQLEMIWKSFLGQSSCSISDSLSLPHLGMMLSELVQVQDVMKVDRTFPKYFKADQPNLVICNSADVYDVILSIYAVDDAHCQPLPGVDEVLLCNASTTAEQVELLCRRANGDIGKFGKIYCLACADLLEYEAACSAEKNIEDFCHNTQGLHFVVICCRETAVHSHLVSALDRYRVELPTYNKAHIVSYLKSEFTLPPNTELASAAVVDPERSCVRMIKSHRAGVGKTLKVHRLHEQMLRSVPTLDDEQTLVTVSLHSRVVNQSEVLQTFLEYVNEPDIKTARIFHISISHEVLEGVDHLLFSLLVLGSLSDANGYVWRRELTDLYLIETMPAIVKNENVGELGHYVHHIFNLLPALTCWSPQDSLEILTKPANEVSLAHPEWVQSEHDQLMDQEEFESEDVQLVYQSLKRHERKMAIESVNPAVPEDSPVECIQSLIRNCGLQDPSWCELRNFVSFMSVQLHDCRQSVFCQGYLSDDLPGFTAFVVRFMLQMSKDFATRSLNISEETPGLSRQDGDVLFDYALKRKWETSPHPYLFFNSDHNSFTFLGFVVNRFQLNLMDPDTNVVLEQNIMSKQLNQALYRNRVNLNERFDDLPRDQKIEKICSVMGQQLPEDRDPTYELTTDNVKKILAIFMRFRCHIPVVIMGETGCGKTRLIKFLCDLWKPAGSDMENMILMKVHGGTTAEDIVNKVNKAAELAQKNSEICKDVGTVLFFDEANTTEAIGLIKEIMCDGTVNGKPLPCTNLHLVAACNPYRRHSEAMIKKQEQAGLGYHVDAKETRDRLGYIPMRYLVYRVQALPQSLLPLVWDFGQLDSNTEATYIKKMVERHLADHDELLEVIGLQDRITEVITASQHFMRLQEDECSFVSLRDVDRLLRVMIWFYNKGNEGLFRWMNECAVKQLKGFFSCYQSPAAYTRSLVLALGVCYHSCLQSKRTEYRKFISDYFRRPLVLHYGSDTFLQEITLCQDVFLDNVELGTNIARNQALKENVFMMVVCIELRIPLFLVGKPGSSKSLAKTIVAHAMQGRNSRHPFFKQLKTAHMVSFQCSPLSTPEGIVGTFKQCSELQRDKDLDKFVAVVVLDEVGLAEDSPKMPLKALHPLLEDGCEDGEAAAKHCKVGFVGISNWALDPAKMNRGILVQRVIPDVEDLTQTARDICSKNEAVQTRMRRYVQPMAEAYLELYNLAAENREFFGLRDFYSLVKMVAAFCKQSGAEPTWSQMKHAIMRNFDGLENVKPLEIFQEHLADIDTQMQPQDSDPKCDAASLIEASLSGICSESRYLLILTENYSALGLLQQKLATLKDAITIFGSSFRKDQQFTQICRNINSIKLCMEAGRTVVLLNLENLYESLYDALNQYYVTLSGKKYVDIGLGTQRIKCQVDDNFRLIVVAEKEVVYKKFPIPLINRLEKHALSMFTMLSQEQLEIVNRLDHWANDFVAETERSIPAHMRRNKSSLTVGDAFIGYKDSAAAVVLQVCADTKREDDDDERIWADHVFQSAQSVLLQCATPEAIVRLPKTRLASRADRLFDQYFIDQQHGSLRELLHDEINKLDMHAGLFLQVTTHSLLLTDRDVFSIGVRLGFEKKFIRVCSLQQFDTEHQFCQVLRQVLEMEAKSRLLLLQCDAGDAHPDLIACARYNIINEFSNATSNTEGVHIVFVIQLPRVAGGCFVGFQGGKWKCYHLDDIHEEHEPLPSLKAMRTKTIGELFESAVNDEWLEQRDVLDDFEAMTLSDDRFAYTPYGMELGGFETANVDHRVIDDFEVDLTLLFGKLETAETKNQQKAVQADKTSFNVEYIIKNCIHKAVATLNDRENVCRRRNTKRLNLLLKLLDDRSKDSLTLMKVLKKRITLLLKDKEIEQGIREHAGDWLTKDVSSVEAIIKAGTFRRSLWQCLESKVQPLLAGIVAYCDRNANLDILMSSSGNDVDSVMHKMWMDMLNDSSVTKIIYRDLKSATSSTELSEFQVVNTGYNNSFFLASFPFSWIVKEQVDSLLSQEALPDVDESRDKGVVRLLKLLPVGKLLENYLHTDAASLVNAYLKDYVQMVYKPSSKNEENLDSEYQLVLAEIRHSAQIGSLLENNDDCLLYFPLIHNTFSRLSTKLQSFSHLVVCRPDCLPMLITRTLHPDISLDLRCCLFILETLQSGCPQLDDPTFQTQWVNDMKQLQPLLLLLLDSIGLYTKHSETVQPFCDLCGYMWNRVKTMQLFIEHVCQSTDTEKKVINNKCKMLFNLLGEKANMKSPDTVEKLEKFLKLCNKQASDYYFQLGKCPHCDNPMSRPVELPCQHKACFNCLVELKDIVQICCCPHPDCKKQFPDDFPLTPLKTKQREIELHDKFRQHCNTFFMDVIYLLSFSSNCPPDRQVVTKLMDYVVCERTSENRQRTVTRVPNVLDNCVDPTPVLRSFLLQLLLRFSVDEVREHLDNYLKRTREALVGEPSTEPTQLVQLCLLTVYCFEDQYRHSSASCTSLLSRIKFAQQLVLGVIDPFLEGSDLLDLGKLELIAQIRFALMEAAIFMHELEIAKDSSLKHVKHAIPCKKFLADLQLLCENVPFKWPRVFLMKQICKHYSIDTLQDLAAVPYLYWIILPECKADEGDPVIDRCVIYGADYMKLRDLTAEILLGQTCDRLSEAYEEIENREQYLILLALFREVTLSYLHKEDSRKPQPEVLTSLSEFCRSSELITTESLVDELLSNTFMFPVGPDLSSRQISIIELLAHCKIALSTSDHELHLPFHTLMLSPADMQETLLPTMPQDNRQEILAALTVPLTEQATLYCCPNGHPYVIGDCGRPYFVARCKICNEEIGGHRHELIQGNTKVADLEDKTQFGHFIGPADLNQGAAPERLLNPLQTAIVRLLLHLAMCLGTQTSTEEICSLIQPAIAPDEVVDYLWQHINADLSIISRVLGKSEDDVLLLMHLILQYISTNRVGDTTTDVSCDLKSKASREKWEEVYTATFVTPVLDGLEAKLEAANEAINSDTTRLGNNRLQQVLFEASVTVSQDDLSHIESHPMMWNYRKHVSVEGLKWKLHETSAYGYQLLQHFLKEEHTLRLVRFIPSIVRLHQVLSQLFSRRIDRLEAQKLHIGDLMKSYQSVLPEDISDLIADFTVAWNSVRVHLGTFGNGSDVLPSDMCQMVVNEQTPIGMLLPSSKGLGRCSLALLSYLCSIQNDFMEAYSQMTKHPLQTSVNVQDAETSQLIAFDPNQDLLQVILTNCSYTLEAGHGTLIDYDFSGIERQIEDRFIHGRPRLNWNEIERIIFSQKSSAVKKLLQLRSQIQQEALPTSIYHAVEDELRGKLNDINTALTNIETAVGYLTTLREDPETSLQDFVSNTLHMQKQLFKCGKARQLCVKHTVSLWLLLSHLHAKLMASLKQDPFDDIDAKYCETLSEELEKELKRSLLSINLDILLPALHECILLQLTVPQDQDQEDVVSNEGFSPSLNDVLREYLTSTDREQSIIWTLPADILVRHCKAVWLAVWAMSQ